MPTVFPTTLDAFTNPSASDKVSIVSHSSQHGSLNDAVEALEAKVGIDSSAVATSLDYLIKSAADPGHTHTVYSLTSHNHTGTYQPLDADLTAIAALSSADGNIIVGSAAGWVAESGATARTSLGLGTGDSPIFAGATINGAFTGQPSADATFKLETAGGELGLYTYRNFAAWDGAFWISYRAHGTKAAPTIVSDGDRLGSFLFRGYDGNGWTSAANIIAEVDGTPGDGDMPGRIIFLTTPNGSDTEVERMRINNAGAVTIANLAGVGTRTVVVDANGVLSAP